MEPIQLKVTAPKTTLPGIDDAIEKLTRIVELEDKLRISSVKPITIRFRVEGAEGLQQAGNIMKGMTSNVSALGAALKEVSGVKGAFKLGENIEAGSVTAGEALPFIKSNVTALTRELDVLDKQLPMIKGKWEALRKSDLTDFAKLDKLTAAERELAALEERQRGVRGTLGQMQFIAGMAESMEGASAGIREAAVAERELTGASEQSAKALDLQDAIIQKKLLSLVELTAKANAAALAEDNLAAAGERSALAGRPDQGLLSRRTVFSKKGSTVYEKFRTGQGTTETYRGDKQVSEEIRFLEAYRNQFNAIEAEFAARQGKFASGSRESIELFHQQADAMRDVIGEMKAMGLGEEELAGKMAMRANAIEARGARAGARLDQKEASQSEADFHKNIAAQVKLEAGEIEKSLSVSKAGARSHEEQAQALKTAAQGYRDLHDAMTRYGQGESVFGQVIDKRATKLGAQADAIERELVQAQQQAQAISQQFHAEARQYPNARRSQETISTDGSTRVTAFDREANGLRETIRLREQYNAQGQLISATQDKISAKIEGTRRGLVNISATFLKNLGTVTVWTAAVSTLYAGLQLLGEGFGAMVHIEEQTARLQAVFRGSREEAVALRDAVLELAVANGRSADEAMDAAIRFARLGLSQKETAELVDVSLKAANVAEITAAEGAEQLTAIMAAYRLEVGQLRSVLNELNTISNTYNVTNKDLFSGIARTSAIAKQAGLPLSELMGIIASGVGRTGRPGAEIGNAVKKMLVSMSNPDTQETLHKKFGFEVLLPTGEMRQGSDLLSELFQKYQMLSLAEREEMLAKIGGAQQASRLQALMDGYVNSLVLAVRAQRDLSSAERENKLVRDTMAADLRALQTEWAKLWVTIGRTGALDALKDIVDGIRELIALMPNGEGGDKGGSDFSKAAKDAPSGVLTFLEVIRSMHEKSKEGTASLNSYNKELERTRELYGSFQNLTRLSHDFGSRVEQLSRDPASFKRQLEQYSSVAYENPADAEKLRSELLTMQQAGDLAGIKARLSERENFARERARELAAEQLDSAKKTLDAEQTRLGILNQQIYAKDQQHQDSSAEVKERADLEHSIAEHSGQAQADFTATMPEEDEQQGPYSGYDESKSRFRARFEAMEELQNAMPKVTDTQSEHVERMNSLVSARLAALDEELGAADKNNKLIEAEIKSRREALQLEQEQLKVKQQYAALVDAAHEGERLGKNESERFKIGRNETEQGINETKGILGYGLLDRARDRIAGAKSPEDKARAEAEVLQLGNRLENIRLSLEERRYKLAAEIANERERENREASKALLMAGREDQLRAALAQRFIQKNGAFSNNQFQFLEQSTKEAVQKFTPGGLPPEIETHARELEKEQALLNKSLAGISAAIQQTTQFIRDNVKPGLAGAGGAGAAPPPPQIHIAPMTFSFGDQFQQVAEIMANTVQVGLQAQIDRMAAQFSAFAASNRVATAQRAATATF